MKIDLNNAHYYYTIRSHKTIRDRLSRMKDMGIEELGNHEFGIPGVFSGFYLERLWSFSDKQFDEYMEWVEEVIEQKKD